MRDFNNLLAGAGANLDLSARRLFPSPLDHRKQPRPVERNKRRSHLHLRDETLAIRLDFAQVTFDLFIGIVFEMAHFDKAHLLQGKGLF